MPWQMRPVVTSLRAIDWEWFIGRKALGWVAVVLIIFAGGFFLKYAFENRWIGPLGRVALAAVAGVGLIIGGRQSRRRGLPIAFQMLTAAGRSLPAGLSAANAVMSEEWAIRFYHACTDQTGDPAQEWPPTDCGSTGLYCCHELMKQGLAGSYKTASGAQNIASLLQGGTVIQGTPYFNAWMEPGPDAFLDGDGSQEALQAAIASGVAGGHETCITALESLAVTETGQVIPEKCVVRVRNSWSASWGDSGSFRLHLSTLQILGSNADFKQFVLAGPPAPAETAGLLEGAAEVIRTIAGSPEKDIDEALAWLASKGL